MSNVAEILNSKDLHRIRQMQEMDRFEPHEQTIDDLLATIDHLKKEPPTALNHQNETESSISKVEFDNAKDSSLVFGAHSPDGVDFEQIWRLHFIDMLTPYCEHKKHSPQKSPRGQIAARLWKLIMNECAKWEIEQGY